MKYEFHFRIEDIEKEIDIIEIKGQGTSKSLKTCLKSIKRDMNSFIKKKIDKLDGKDIEDW